VARGYEASEVDQSFAGGLRLVGQLRFDAGNLTLDLIATVGRRFGAPVERLTGPDRLEAWVRGAGLRLVLTATTIDAFPVPLEWVADGSDLVASPAVPAADIIVGLVARDTVVLLLGPDRGRIAECAARDCRMLYIRPPGARRVWCSSAHCGNRNRVAANYARTKGRSVAAEANR
jgi:hypothetical protein